MLTVYFLLIIIFVFATTVYSFTTKVRTQYNRFAILLRAKVEVADSASIADGKTQVVKTTTGEVIIGNLKGKFYAVDAKCPHLG